MRANDPTPPYRDEQRAFYDSLRDVGAAANGYTLIRLMHGAFDWQHPGAPGALARVLEQAGIPLPSSALATAATPADGDRVRRIALVSHDYRRRDAAGLWDYSAHFRQINQLCDQQGCDTVLYALYTWDSGSKVPHPGASLFSHLVNVRQVVMEAGDLSANSGSPGMEHLSTEVWLRGQPEAAVLRQRFATSQNAATGGAAFVADLPQRQFADGLLMICGETNIVNLVRKTGAIHDPHQFNQKLVEAGIRVILNPVHDYMRRYEMKEKRRYFSAGGRWVVSVWNQGRGRRSAHPWTAFHDEVDITARIAELQQPHRRTGQCD